MRLEEGGFPRFSPEDSSLQEISAEIGPGQRNRSHWGYEISTHRGYRGLRDPHHHIYYRWIPSPKGTKDDCLSSLEQTLVRFWEEIGLHTIRISTDAVVILR
ncbi:hypothetical protein NPIL_307191 [Nephila pilipes]|uniref:Uncharacterized protein n=1 Tax=Nephila pilipes TaxID=299642 RepID=A0A8X6NXS0_NEPPI|nr:hypothetical protein NPIL_307191 [Nephila pilipes]